MQVSIYLTGYGSHHTLHSYTSITKKIKMTKRLKRKLRKKNRFKALFAKKFFSWKCSPGTTI